MPSPKPVKWPSASLSVSAAFDFGCLVDGVWTYRDPQQYALVSAVQAALAWDIQSFDAWLFGSDHWKSYPRVRQRMIDIRGQLTVAWLAPTATEEQRELDIKSYFRAMRQVSAQLNNLPTPLRQSMLAVVDYKAEPTSTKLDAKHITRIQRLYQEMVQSGRKYGAQTQLARQYGVSLATIRKVLELHKSA